MPLENPAARTGRIEPEALNETNMLELYVFASEKHRQAVLLARLDNLGKGASGAAVQNMRLMLNLRDKEPRCKSSHVAVLSPQRGVGVRGWAKALFTRLWRRSIAASHPDPRQNLFRE